MGFEPTPADADEKPLIRGKLSLESHTLDHSVISPCEESRAVAPRRALPVAALESSLKIVRRKESASLRNRSSELVSQVDDGGIRQETGRTIRSRAPGVGHLFEDAVQR